MLDPYPLLRELERHPDRKDAIGRWAQYCKTDPYRLDAEDWERLYLPSDDEDTRNPATKTPQIPLLWDTRHVSRRVAAQRSRFMIFGSDPRWLANFAERKNSKLKSIRIPTGAINGIKRQLRDAGVTESVVCPDLDGLGRELKQLWQERR